MKPIVLRALQAVCASSEEAQEIVNSMYEVPTQKELQEKVLRLNNEVLELSLQLGGEDVISDEQGVFLRDAFLKRLPKIPPTEWYWRYDEDYFVKYAPSVRKILAKTLVDYAHAQPDKNIRVLQLWSDLCTTNGEM